MLSISREKFEAARAELDLFVAEWLTEYLSKTVAVDTPPRWTWTAEWSMHYRRTEKTIYISELYLKAYILSPSKAKRALRWSLAHEYWHYVQDVRGGPFALPILDFPRMAEYLSDKHAVLLSGISDAEGQSLTVDVVDLVMFYEGERESPVAVKFVVEWKDERGFPFEEEYSTREEAERVVSNLLADGIKATIHETTSREFKVRYIDQTTGQTVEKTISETEQYDLYKDQREGRISIIEIKPVE